MPVVGVGSTPTCSNPPNALPNVTEMHPGNYIYYDTMQEVIGGVEDGEVGGSFLAEKFLSWDFELLKSVHFLSGRSYTPCVFAFQTYVLYGEG